MKRIWLLLLIISYAFSAIASSTQAGRAENEVKQLRAALECFKLDHGHYPSQQEGLLALVNKPATISAPQWEPYFRDLPRTDTWGHDYVYRYPGIHNPKSFDLYSCGEDGISKTGGSDRDDINSWDFDHPWRRHYSPGYPRRLLAEFASWLAIGLTPIIAFFVWRRRHAGPPSSTERHKQP
jgi:general secretion pathway protein G